MLAIEKTTFKQLIDGLVLMGWEREMALRFFEKFPKAFFSVDHLDQVEAVNTLDVFAAYEDIPSN
jgi:hypothetical protein